MKLNLALPKILTPEKYCGELLIGDNTLSFASFQLAKSNLADGFIESNLAN
jgi:lactoylglutathione lyase